MHKSSFDKMKLFRERYLSGRETETLRIYDLGSLDVNGSYRTIFAEAAWRYQGLDLVAGKNVDIVLQSPYTWREIPSNSADVVISGQAFEHIRFFWMTILEILRVLKPGGLCCILAPSGGPEHRYPCDCWRFYPDGFVSLASFARMEVLEASTQWEELDYLDGSNVWRDSMLVCRKPQEFGTLTHAIRLWLCHRVLKSWLKNAA